MYELLIYPIVSNNNLKIIHNHTDKEWKRLEKNIKKINFYTNACKLLEVKKYNKELLYVKLEYYDGDENRYYDPLQETPVRFMNTLNENNPSFYLKSEKNKIIDKFVAIKIKEKYSKDNKEWENYFYK